MTCKRSARPGMGEAQKRDRSAGEFRTPRSRGGGSPLRAAVLRVRGSLAAGLGLAAVDRGVENRVIDALLRSNVLDVGVELVRVEEGADDVQLLRNVGGNVRRDGTLRERGEVGAEL